MGIFLFVPTGIFVEMLFNDANLYGTISILLAKSQKL